MATRIRFTTFSDGEGRTGTVSASSGPNPLTSTTYSGFGVTGITFGSGDSDSFSYDPNTGRETQYKFTVNGANETGTLTWNANGTLQKLAISDPFIAANLFPFLPGLSNGSEEGLGVASRVAYNRALSYAANSPSQTFGTLFLRYSFKSSIVRGLLSKSAVLADAASMPGVVTAEGQALYSEVQSMKQGACQ